MLTFNRQGAALLAKALFLFVLLLALPASADSGLQYKSCTAAQQQSIAEAITTLQQQLGYALEWLREGELRPYISTWFGKTVTEREIDDALTALLARMETKPPLIFTCAENGCKGDMLGYAGSHETHICPSFFSKPQREGYNTQAGMLVHELSHLVLNTRDYVYGRPQARALAAQRPTLALGNADNYQNFIESLMTPDVYGALPANPANACLFAFDGICDEGSAGRFVCAFGTDTADCTSKPAPDESVPQITPFGQSRMRE